MTLASLALAGALAGGAVGGHLHDGCQHGHGDREGLPPLVAHALERVDASPENSYFVYLADQSPASPTSDPAPPDPARASLERDIQRDIEMGKKYSEEVAKELKFSEDEAVVKRVEKIGQELAAIANELGVDTTWGDRRHSRFPYTFKVVKDDDVNAFSIPGGHIYIYEGLIKFAESDSELAGVIAHEISHASMRHVAEMQRRASRLDLLQIPLIIAAIMSRSSEGLAVLQGATLANQAFKSGWSLNAETAADWGAIQYMKRSNYSPVGVLTLMERLAFRDANNAQINWGIYATHPPSRERAAAIESRLKDAGISIRRSEVTTSLRATSAIADDQGIDFFFGKTKLHTFRGEGAIERAERAVTRLNRFADSTPGLEALTREGYEIRGSFRPLFEVSQEDLLPGQELDSVFVEVLTRLRSAIFELNFRLWSQRARPLGER